MMKKDESWSAFQEQVSEWARRNFGSPGAYQPMLGLIEEIGEYFAADELAFVRDKQEKKEDAIADQVIYALNLADECGIQLGDIIKIAYPQNFTERQLLGALALCSRAVLKHDQGIRGFDHAKRRVTMETGLRVWASWAQSQCGMMLAIPLYGCARRVWDDIVSKRDWKKNPVTAASQEQTPPILLDVKHKEVCDGCTVCEPDRIDG